MEKKIFLKKHDKMASDSDIEKVLTKVFGKPEFRSGKVYSFGSSKVCTSFTQLFDFFFFFC
jgi:hypothetical protein